MKALIPTILFLAHTVGCNSGCAMDIEDASEDVGVIQQELTTNYNVINTNPNINGQPGMRPMALATVSDRRMTSLRCDMMRRVGTTYLCVGDGPLTFFCTRTGGAAGKNYFTEPPGGTGGSLLQIFEAVGATRAQGGYHRWSMTVPNAGQTTITGSYAPVGGTSGCNIGAGGLSASNQVTIP